MHFIDYFPHRELGVVYYFSGDFQAAQSELELSLKQFPTAKAHFYLNQVRRAIIEKKGLIVPPPKIYLSVEKDELWTRQDPVRLSGWAEDPNYISGINVNSEPIFIESAQKRIQFSKDLELSQGIHHVQVLATNLGRKISRRTIKIHVDRQGPLIGLNEVTMNRRESSNVLRITGTLYDESRVAKVLINGIAYRIQPGTVVPLSYEIPFSEKPVNIVAVDRLGNKTSGEIKPDMLSNLPDRQLMASLQVNGAQFFVGSRDTDPPIIELSDQYDRADIYLDKVYLEGHVRDNNKITRLSINNVLIWQHENRLVYFGHLIELKEGLNEITLEAVDKFGNLAIIKITINRKIPKVFLLDARLRLSVFPFEKIGQRSLNNYTVNDYLTLALVKRRRFKMIERLIFDSILQEHKISRTQLVDDQTALGLGKLMAAQSIVTGSLIMNSMGLEIVARVIDTETAEILATLDVYNEFKDPFSLKKLAEGLAIKIHREFPLVDGQIVKYNGSHIFTNLGQEQLRAQRRLIVYHEEPVEHFVSGKSAGTDYIIDDHARVIQVGPNISKAELISNKFKKTNIHHRVMPQ
jgi:hypothetical protein